MDRTEIDLQSEVLPTQTGTNISSSTSTRQPQMRTPKCKPDVCTDCKTIGQDSTGGMADATIACRHCKCRCRKSSRSSQRRHSRHACESGEVPGRRSRGRSGFASELGHVRWASPPEARLCTAMTGDQVVNTAIGGFGVHVGQVALQMSLMWSQSLNLAVVSLHG